MLRSGSCGTYIHEHVWEEAAAVYLSETWKRQVIWHVGHWPEIQTRTHAREDCNQSQTARFSNFIPGHRPCQRGRVVRIWLRDIMVPHLIWQNSRDSWEIEDFCDLFKVLKLKPPSEKEIFDKFVAVVKFSVYTDGYNWSFWKTVGGARTEAIQTI